MNKELFISSTPHETKVAVVEDDLLAEIYFERENEYTLAGSIYKGRVTRIMGIGVFVEILPGKEGLIRMNQLAPQFVERAEDVVKEGEEIVTEIVQPESSTAAPQQPNSPFNPIQNRFRPRQAGGGGGGGGGGGARGGGGGR